MSPIFRATLELLNGEACRAHPGDASLPLSRRFHDRLLVVIGGGGTALGWTQRVRMTRTGHVLEAHRSVLMKRSTVEWSQHLTNECRASSGWAVLLVEQQWQAALAPTSAASLGAHGVERMLRVRDSIRDFGDDRISEDAIRAAVDHPTMEGAVVVGVRPMLLDLLEKEARAAGFEIAAIRVPSFALLEHRLNELHGEHTSPDRTLVAFDGQSSLIIGMRDGAFDPTEGAFSYLVNRSTSDVRVQLGNRLTRAQARAPGTAFELIGVAIGSAENGLQNVELRHTEFDPLSACLDDRVVHDLRTHLQEMRIALPRWTRVAAVGALTISLACLVGIAAQVCTGVRLRRQIEGIQLERNLHQAGITSARTRVAALKKEEAHAHELAEWLDRNYHAQALLHRFLGALPLEVSLDAVSIQAAEGLPQARLKFTLLGTEDAQRAALRSIESELYALGYEIGRRDDPSPSNHRQGAVVYAWDLIAPHFGD